MAAASIRTAGVFLVLVPTVAYGGVSLLGFISRRSPGYLDNPVRQNLFRAGHAHAGVLIILALVGRRDPHPGHRTPARLTPHTRRRCRRPRSALRPGPKPVRVQVPAL